MTLLIFLLVAVKECKEEVISRDPCHLKTCPEGEQSNPEYVYYPCSMPEVCPQKEIDQTAKCCEEKCGKTSDSVCLRTNSFAFSPRKHLSRSWCFCYESYFDDNAPIRLNVSILLH